MPPSRHSHQALLLAIALALVAGPATAQQRPCDSPDSLGPSRELGRVEKGKLADLVVLKGDLTADPTVIRNPTVVFKDGIGYDSAKLVESIQGRVGID